MSGSPIRPIVKKERILMDNNGRFSLRTKAGCCRVLAICLAVILVCGLFAHVLSTNMGKVKIT